MPETFVVDCSVAAKWILPEPGRPAALHLLDQWQSGEIALIAPNLLLFEFASLLAKRFRRKQLTAAQAAEAYQLLAACAPRLYDPSLPLALELALSHQLSLWDCIYLALAVEHDCRVLTADQRLFRSAAARHPSISLLASER